MAAPNIIVIVTDDHRAAGTMDIDPTSEYADPMAKTKRWFHTGGSIPGYGTVTGGTKFPNGIAPLPLCCPARASIFTGQYSHNNGVTGNGVAENIVDDQTIQKYLHASSHNYRTGIFGKYLNAYDAKSQFLNPSGLFQPLDFDDWGTFEGQFFPVRVNEQGTYKTLTQYSTDYLEQKGVNFIQQARSSAQPFFLYVAPSAPHFPWLPEPDYANEPIPPFSQVTQSPKFLEEDRSDKPEFVHGRSIGEAEVEETRAAQLRTLFSVDDMVHGILSSLTPEEQSNTIAFFVGDNGWHWGDHGRDGKATAYEDSIKVPFYMRWPGQVPANRTDPSLVANIDVAPTVMDAVDLTPQPTEPMDGRSLIDPAEQDPSGFASKRNRQLGEANTSWNSIRTKTFVYIESDRATETPQNTDPDFYEYYDLTRDPEENENLLQDSDPENDPPTSSLQDQLVDDKDCVGTNCPPGASDDAIFPADTAITAKPDLNTNKTSARFVFTSSVPNSTFECKLPYDGILNWTDCGGSGWPYTRTYSGLSSAPHLLLVRATAPGGSPDPTPASHAWVVDSTPDTDIGSKPAKLSNQSAASFTFTATAGAGFECKLDSGTFASCTSPKSYSGLSDGSHTFSVKVSGDSTPATYDWTVDATAPTISDPWPPNGQDFASGDFVIVPQVTPESGNVRPFRCSLNGQPAVRCGGGGVEKELYKGLPSGSHTITVSATDFAGNAGTPHTESFTINRTPTFASDPEAGWPEVSNEGSGAPSEVLAVIPDGSGGWYVGGNFTELCDAGGSPCHARTDLAHIRSDKTVDPGFAPTTNGTVRALALSGGTLYAVGGFSTVDGTGRNNAAAVSASNGSLTSWDPNANGVVNDVTIAGGSAYLVGAFGTVGGATHRRVAEVSATGSGGVTTWAAGLDAGTGTELHAVETTGSSVYVGGTGTLIDGSTTRNHLAAIDRTSGTISSWNPDPKCVNESGFVCATNPVYVRSLQLSPDAAGIFVGGYFNRIGVGSPIRRSVAEIALSDGAATGWNPLVTVFNSVALGTVYDVETRDLTNGSSSTRWGTLLAGPFNVLKTRYFREGLAEVFRYGAYNADGWPGDWKPEPDYTGTRHDVAVSGDVAAVAGNFKSFGFTERKDIAFFRDPAPDTTITSPTTTGVVTANHDQSFSYTSSESGSAFECSLDDAAYGPCGNGSESYTDLSTGVHTFRVRAKDVRGTVDPSPALYAWTIQDYSNDADTGWPQVDQGSEIRAIIADGSGGWYVGGNFSRLCGSNGCHDRSNIAHIKSDKTIDSWNPGIGPGAGGGVPVRALALKQSTNTLYVGGAFSSVNADTNYAKLAAIDTQTGGHLTWDPNVVAWVYGLALSPDTDTIYVGGTFGLAGATQAVRNRLAEIRLSDAEETSWDPNVSGVPGAGPQVWAIALSDTKLYAGGINIGGAGSQTNTGNLIEVDRATGATSATWRPMPNNAVHSLALRSPSSSTLFVGGTFTSIGSTAQSRNKAAEINLDTTGTATSWDPQAAGGGAATYALGFVQGTVLIGGQWTSIHGEPRTRLAQTTGSLGAPLTWAPSLDSAPFTMATQGSVLAVGGVFLNAGATPRKYLAFYGPPD